MYEKSQTIYVFAYRPSPVVPRQNLSKCGPYHFFGSIPECRH